MIKKYAAGAVTVLILIVFYLVIGRLYEYAAGQNKINDYNRQRFEDFYSTPNDSLDWVFLGSSHAYCTFDPAQFDAAGIASFQMGMPLQTMDSTYFTLLEILKTQRPDTVVLDVYWYVLEQDFEVKQMEMLFQVMRDENFKKQYLSEVLPWNERIKYTLKPVRYQADFLAFANTKLLNVMQHTFGLKKTENYTPGEEFYQGRGYVHFDYTMSDSAYSNIAEEPIADMQNWKIAASQQKYLDKIVACCKDNDIRLILTVAPVSNVRFSRIKNYAAFSGYISDYAARNGLRYLDFNTVNAADALFDDDCFFDGNHLNIRGVEIADAYFLEWLSLKSRLCKLV